MSTPYVKGSPEAEEWFRQIKEMIMSSAKDERDPVAAFRGMYWILAWRMTTDDRLELARCIWKL